MAGRGFGKTRTGAEWIRALAQNQAGCEISLVGASFDEAASQALDSKWAGQVPRRAKEIAAMIAKG